MAFEIFWPLKKHWKWYQKRGIHSNAMYSILMKPLESSNFPSTIINYWKGKVNHQTQCPLFKNWKKRIKFSVSVSKATPNFVNWCNPFRLRGGMVWFLKVAFFQKVWWNFFRSPNLKKKIFQKSILSLKFKFFAYYYRWEI